MYIHSSSRLLFSLVLTCTLNTQAQDTVTNHLSLERTTVEYADLKETSETTETTTESIYKPSISDLSRNTWPETELGTEVSSQPSSITDNFSTWSTGDTTSFVTDSNKTKDENWNDWPDRSTSRKDDPFDFGSTHNWTRTSEKSVHPTEPIQTDDDIEWNHVEDCVLTYVECVEPVRCKGHGKVDCSQKEKTPWMAYDYNSSLIDQLLPKEPRVKRASNTKVSRERKKFNISGSRRTVPSQEEDLSSGVPCWTESTLMCSFKLNLNNCRGVGQCDASPSDVTSSSLADWEIAVISVLTLAGALLLGLLVYVIYGAWRKKKVQPMSRRSGSMLS